MLRLTELRLPLDHTEEELRAAILAELGLRPAELVSYSIFRRSLDARKRGRAILTYHLDVTTTNESAVLEKLRGRSRGRRRTPRIACPSRRRMPRALGPRDRS